MTAFQFSAATGLNPQGMQMQLLDSTRWCTALAVAGAAVLLTTACAGRGGTASVPVLPAALVPGVSLELARHRAATLSDVAYTLDLAVGAGDTLAGRVRIDVTRSPSADDLVLDFRGTALHEVRANGAIIADARHEEDHVVVPARHLRTGANELELRFTAPVAAAGAAVISYDDVQDSARYLYTLLVPSDAQLLFPVFDQPDIKARFTWHITAPAGWRVLTNGAPLGRDSVAGGRVRHSFATTQPISTYTAAFAAGPWSIAPRRPVGTATTDGAAAVVKERAATADGRNPTTDARTAAAMDGDRTDPAAGMTLWTRRSRATEVDADTLLRLNGSALRWLEAYFEMEYPFGKLDLLLAPAFPFGGMEHVGAIFYNESNFIFREPPTLSRRLGRAATIYHEVAHQWFGDLVTMTWFDDLWLKEGFATFMAAKMQEDLHPGTGAWKTFYLRNKPLAYGVDVTAGTTPVWQELPNLDLAKSNYGPIVYNKAPAILKQLEFLVGDDAFRRGLQIFLQRHAYGNATWNDLLAAITESSGQNLRAFGEHYILRAGIPIVETMLSMDGEGRISALDLQQRPARLLPGDRGGAWPGRVRVRLGYRDADDVVLDVPLTGTTTQIRQARGLPAPDYVFANDGDYGYGIFLPDTRSAAWLLEHAGGLQDDLLRAMAWGALWDLVREARVSPNLFATAAMRAFAAERDEQIASQLLGRVRYAIDRYIADPTPRSRLAAQLEELLLQRIAADSLDYGLRRSALDALLGGARSPRAVGVLKEYLAGARQFDGRPLGPPSRWAAVTRLVALNDPDALALLRAEQARDSTPEGPRLAFIAGAARPTVANKQAYYERYFSDEALNEEWVTSSLAAFNHDLHSAMTLPFLQPALASSLWLRENRRIFFLPRWLDSFIGGQSSPEALHIVDEFLDQNPDLPPDIRRRILQARDELERVVRIRGAGAP
jgi:aminopeptidase N